MTSPKMSSKFNVAGVPRDATAACVAEDMPDVVNMGGGTWDDMVMVVVWEER